MTCDKASFATEREALAELARLRTKRVTDQWKIPHRAYVCHCGYWHLTSAPLREPREGRAT